MSNATPLARSSVALDEETIVIRRKFVRTFYGDNLQMTNVITVPASGPRPFGYAAFIEELRLLTTGAQSFAHQDRTADSDVFRRWKHELGDAISRIEGLKYSINTQFESRLFQILGYGSYSKKDQYDRFSRDLKDTLNELEVLINNFDRYGDPKKPASSGTKIAQNIIEQLKNVQPEDFKDLPKEFPDKVTPHWLWVHMPFSIWVGLVVAFASVFAIGIAIGKLHIW